MAQICMVLLSGNWIQKNIPNSTDPGTQQSRSSGTSLIQLTPDSWNPFAQFPTLNLFCMAGPSDSFRTCPYPASNWWNFSSTLVLMTWAQSLARTWSSCSRSTASRTWLPCSLRKKLSKIQGCIFFKEMSCGKFTWWNISAWPRKISWNCPLKLRAWMKFYTIVGVGLTLLCIHYQHKTAPPPTWTIF